MSAYVVSDDHIDLLATVAVDLGLSWYHGGKGHTIGNIGANGFGAMLLAENVASVNYRYSENHAPHDYSWRRVWEFADGGDKWRVAALKACACYEYQSCEHPEWDESEAQSAVDALRRALIRSLSEYEDAPWEFTRGAVM